MKTRVLRFPELVSWITDPFHHYKRILPNHCRMMPRGWLCATFAACFLLYRAYSHPVTSDSETAALSLVANSEKSWLWGWAWGAESTVSVVDRTPALSFPSRPAAFGADIRDPILGYVIPLSSFTSPCTPNNTTSSSELNYGCPDLCIDGHNSPTETWIALVQRGKCEFVKKVREAQRLGARAVVVGGENPDITGYPDTLVNMYSPEDSSDVTVPATYITYSDYSQLSSLIASSNTSHSGLRTLSLLITAEYSAWEWYSPIITFVVILLLPSVLTFITLLIHRIRAARAAQRDRAPEEIVHNLPWHIWAGTGWEKHEENETLPNTTPLDRDLESGIVLSETSTDENDQLLNDFNGDSSTSDISKTQKSRPWFEAQVECAICLSDFAKGDKVRVLPCHHIFHLDEVDEWLIQRKKLCPVCKADVTLPSHHPAEPPNSNSMESNPHGTLPLRPTSPYDDANERTPLLRNNRSL